MSGETSLWTAVIMQAIWDYDLTVPGLRGKEGDALKDAKRKREEALDARISARKWMRSNEDRDCSFTWVCDCLSLDARKIREICETFDGRVMLRTHLAPDNPKKRCFPRRRVAA